MKLELQATPEEVMRAVAALERFAEETGVPADAVFGLTLALEESASNVVNHALQRDPARTFTVSLERTADQFVIEIRDPGVPFDPTAVAERGAAEDDDPEGGWGVQLVRRFIDQIAYERTKDENVLRLCKTLATSGDAE